LFDSTGGIHAAGIFTAAGELLALAEDVGRHNAVDKVIGILLAAGVSGLPGTILQISGRGGYEILLKAWKARIPMVAAVGAPSSLAVDMAQRAGITLVGFMRGPKANIYTHPERLGFHDSGVS
jgi:FdhD protein